MNSVSYTSPFPEAAYCRAHRSTWATTASVTALSRTYAKVATTANRSWEFFALRPGGWVGSVDFGATDAPLRVMAGVLGLKALDAAKCRVNVVALKVRLSS
jgi:hypothetical protein